MLDRLPPELKARAFLSGSDELAWTLSDALLVAHVFSNTDVAILGWELWVVTEDGTIIAVIPSVDGGPPVVHHWEVEPDWKQGSETWNQFCRRASEYTIAVISRLDLTDVPAELRPWVRCNLTYVARDEYIVIEEFVKRFNAEKSVPKKDMTE